MQQQKSLGNSIVDVLMDIRTSSNLSLTNIAVLIGVDKAHLNKVANRNKEGSLLLLRALELLKSSLAHPAMPWPDEDFKIRAERRAKASGMTLEEFAMWCAIRYGDKLADEIIVGKPGLNLAEVEKSAAGLIPDLVKATTSPEYSPSPQAVPHIEHKPSLKRGTHKRSGSRHASPK